jgi:hypothetical protein
MRYTVKLKRVFRLWFLAEFKDQIEIAISFKHFLNASYFFVYLTGIDSYLLLT